MHRLLRSQGYLDGETYRQIVGRVWRWLIPELPDWQGRITALIFDCNSMKCEDVVDQRGTAVADSLVQAFELNRLLAGTLLARGDRARNIHSRARSLDAGIGCKLRATILGGSPRLQVVAEVLALLETEWFPQWHLANYSRESGAMQTDTFKASTHLLFKCHSLVYSSPPLNGWG